MAEQKVTHVNVIIKVKEDADLEKIRSLLAEHGQNSKKEAGCEQFNLYHSNTNPRIFFLVEQWSSSQALDVHKQQRSFIDIWLAQISPHVTLEAHFCALL
eukprot:TRINITY_DN6612_c0_g1_i1.p1 TRINITY_DN6612_c0_g1~~TRINITY_DN6612_c0_g1_i1.p1  ORF type:complete len:100 (+),score=17.11 TRINITY_DN6612_c0_g1_i1:98-397(+)